MKQKKKFLCRLYTQPNSFFFFSFFSQIFTSFQQVKTICPQIKFTNVQFFLFFSNLYTVYFSEKCSGFFLFFFPLCYVQWCSSFFSFPLCLFPLSCTFFFLFIINCSFTILFFSNFISTSLRLYLNIITIGSLPRLFNFYQYLHKISLVY